MKIENENTFLAALNNRLNLFVGAGFSSLATDNEGNQLPTGPQLGTELTQLFGLHPNLGLPQIATILNSSKKSEFRAYLKSRFTVAGFDPLYRIIEKLPIKSIFTTNIDNLIHEIYKGGTASYINDLDIRGATFSDRNAVNLVTLHGCVLDDFRELVFDATDLASAYANDPDRWHYLTQALESTPTLFCGYSVTDSGTLTSLNRSGSGGQEKSDKWITVLPGTDQGTLEYFKALGFQIIECDIRDLLDYLNTNYRPARARQPITSTRELFPEWAIPDVSVVPVRPIFDFFRGAPPTWYDVYFSQLATTSHHARVRDALNSQRHTLITGIPGSGKTTLMMQILKDFPFLGHKLLCDSLPLREPTLC